MCINGNIWSKKKKKWQHQAKEGLTGPAPDPSWCQESKSSIFLWGGCVWVLPEDVRLYNGTYGLCLGGFGPLWCHSLVCIAWPSRLLMAYGMPFFPNCIEMNHPHCPIWRLCFFFFLIFIPLDQRENFLIFVPIVVLQALHSNALPVFDMCKQWLAQYM